MKSHTVTGGGGARLNVVETGKPNGRPILFIHGFSQCSLAWNRQLNSDLADNYRLLAMDMRGHGLSDKPQAGYDDSTLWADDVNAVIQQLGLDGVILCGWSYGPLVILDYIRHYREERIGGLIFVGGITKLGSDEAMSVITPEFLGLAPALFSADAEESAGGLKSLLRMCFAHELSSEDRDFMLGYNVSVPSSVRQALFSRLFDNDDLLPTIRKPMLIVHGLEDAVVKLDVIDRQLGDVTHAQVEKMANAGHAPFWDDAAGFNQRLRKFFESV